MTKGKRKSLVTRTAVRKLKHGINWETQAKRDTIKAGRRDYGGGKSK